MVVATTKNTKNRLVIKSAYPTQKELPRLIGAPSHQLSGGGVERGFCRGQPTTTGRRRRSVSMAELLGGVVPLQGCQLAVEVD